jgi:putative endonuclease
MNHNKQLGSQGETLVCDYLRRHGYEILETNYASRYGEIDIIAREEGDICFIEVKTRSDDSLGDPLEAITPAKRRKIERMAQWYLTEQNWEDVNARFDAVSVLGNSIGVCEIEIIKNAFELGEVQ